jgi:hypothetical protein
MSGESIHDLGREGARRAKRWLEATTRAHVHWTNPGAAQKLSFQWADGGWYSFDLGGVLRGEDLAGKEFYAETKFYRSAGDQGSHYRGFLARCYRSLAVAPGRCDVFMWITWSPFLVNSWDRLRSARMVRECVEENGRRVFGPEYGEDKYAGLVDESQCEEVARRTWLLVLSEHLEMLVLTREHRGVVAQHIGSRE